MDDNISLLELRNEVRRRTDYVNSDYLTDTDLNQWINDSAKEFYDQLIATFDGYNVASQDFAITSGNTFACPTDFYKLQGVDLVVALPDQFQTLRRVKFSERNSAVRGYDLRGSTVVILPYSWAAGNTFRLWYTPTTGTATQDTDTLNGVNGWNEYIVVDVCIKVCAKSGEDPSVFLAQKAAMAARIDTMAKSRDEGEPATTVDVRGSDTYGSLIGGRFLTDWS